MFETHNYEVYTMTDKAKRDDIFRQCRESKDPLERQAVKFSGVRPILQANGNPEYRIVRYRYSSSAKTQVRFMFESTWSVAYPRT